MKLQFKVKYRTNWGEDVRVKVLIHFPKVEVDSYPWEKGLFSSKTKHVVQPEPKEFEFHLESSDGYHWQGEFDIQEKKANSLTYRYFIYRDGKPVREEWNFVPRSFPVEEGRSYRFYDAWRDVPEAVHTYSSLFTRCVRPREDKATEPVPQFDRTLLLSVLAPGLKEGEKLAVLGNQPGLGNWNADRYLLMQETQLNTWQLSLNADGLRFPLEYKFVVIDKSVIMSPKFQEWEQGDNRCIHELPYGERQTLVIDEAPLRLPERRWKAAGTVIPVFSLRSEKSWGIGDFTDIKRMVDWMEQTGQHVLQLLPVNDTIQNHNWMDSYPYNAISVYALNPMYINPLEMGPLKSESATQRYLKKARELNELEQVDFEAVLKLKFKYFKEYYKEYYKEGGLPSEVFDFIHENRYWIFPYAGYCVLRDDFKTSDFTKWGHYATYNFNEIKKFFHPDSSNHEEFCYYCFLQYEAHRQLKDATDYARAHGVAVKGDIPIGVASNSVDAWSQPEYFNRDKQTGAPPDDFSVNGQNWGFPTYNWERILQDDGKWWKNRFQQMANYFDAYRIDHVLGFFRIWEIPMDSVHGLLGQFVPALPLTVDEIEGYGLHFRYEAFTRPYITEKMVNEIFGLHADYVKRNFLKKNDYDLYEMAPEFATQRQVQHHFRKKTDEHSVWIRDGLYSLISNVLFVKDRDDAEKFHPRIAAMNDYLYKDLSETEQQAFARLYEDYFYHRHNRFWYEQAMRKLPMLVSSSSMLACAEDLGMVPECVPWVMEELRILTLEIQRMPKAFGVEFAHTEHYPYHSVSTISTHDMSTLRGWWEEDYAKSNRFYHEILQKDGDAPRVMPAWLCEEVIARHLYSPSMLTLLSWQDWMSMDEMHRLLDVDAERINVPANPRHYWRYRMHIYLEDLCKMDGLNEKISALIRNSGRWYTRRSKDEEMK